MVSFVVWVGGEWNQLYDAFCVLGRLVDSNWELGVCSLVDFGRLWVCMLCVN